MKTELQVSLVLTVLVVLTRTVLHVAPNVEFVTAAGVSAGLLFKDKRIAVGTVLISLLLSDLIIGNSVIFVFTWSGFMFAPVISWLASGKIKSGRVSRLAIYGTISGIISTLFFFLWTNLGVVLTTNMYSKDVAGVMHSYLNALPFLRNQLAGNIFIVPVVILGVYTWLRFEEQLNPARLNKAIR
jgi:hypothetical protein